MALGTDHITAAVVPNFIPELWSDEIVAAYKKNLVAASLVRKINHRGKKGDTVRIPTPTRGVASDKAATTQVTLLGHGTDTGITLLINKHKEYSRLIEDFADVQALESLRRFYTDDSGYSIAKRVDNDLLVEFFNTGSASLTWTAATNLLTTASTFDTIREGDGTSWDEAGTTDLTDVGIRAFIKVLDDADAPQADRAFIVPTIVKSDLLGLARFTEQAFTGEVGAGNSIRNGKVGDIYGSSVYVTTNTPLVEDGLAAADNISGFYIHKDSTVLLEQLGVRSQLQYKQEYLAELFTVDMIYGYGNVRDSSIVTFVVPTT